jgi:hypothetical protein|tara:strand:+ start:247 stop:417 length:171 start_codon:yes stop_codon:yes gene_type:complete
MKREKKRIYYYSGSNTIKDKWMTPLEAKEHKSFIVLAKQNIGARFKVMRDFIKSKM